MLKLYKYYEDCGRMGEIEGLFAATEAQVNQVIGKEVYFGEILGKHSDIAVEIEESDIKLITDSQKFIKELILYFNKSSDDNGMYTFIGYNPIEYYLDFQEDEEEDENYL